MVAGIQLVELVDIKLILILRVATLAHLENFKLLKGQQDVLLVLQEHPVAQAHLLVQRAKKDITVLKVPLVVYPVRQVHT